MSQENEKKLSDFLCFALYSANYAMQRATRQAFDDIGLTYTQYLVLVTLWEQDGQLVNEVGQKLYLKSNTLTPITKKLESMGHVTRTREETDQRNVRIHLTQQGKKLREKTDGFFCAVKEISGLNEKEFTELQSKIVKLRDHLIEPKS